jgi:hypothetical protein
MLALPPPSMRLRAGLQQFGLDSNLPERPAGVPHNSALCAKCSLDCTYGFDRILENVKNANVAEDGLAFAEPRVEGMKSSRPV